MSGYKKPPILRGYTYDPVHAYAARDDGRLLALRVETNTTCNLKCRYCYAESGDTTSKQLPYPLLTKTIDEAQKLGVESIVVIGGGEPTLYERFRDLIAYINDKNMLPVVFTNTILVDEELAKYLHENNASVMGKMDSLKPEVEDYLVGREGAFESIRGGLQNLMDAGFSNPEDPHNLRLGVSFVTNKMNIGEIDRIWGFCRENNIFPNMEILTPTGRAKDELNDLTLTESEIKDYKLQLLDLDRKKYGYDWLPYTPLTASGCLQ
ncbi:MAG: radical SAM protein, partial [Candidatus Altiarchaeales archaeon]|nr:radical SAM protein [Candidatus Altiarchaeales archaeon]